MIAAVESEFPNIKLNVTGETDIAKGIQLQKTRFLAEEGIDLLTGRPESFMEYVEAGYLMDLTGLPILDNIKDGHLEDMTVDGSVYAVPTAVNVIGVWYNKDIFSDLNLSVPVTWDEFTGLLDDLVAAGYTYPIIHGWADSWPIQFSVYPFIHSILANDPDIFTKLENGDVKYTDEIWMDAFKKMEEFMKAGYINPDSQSLGYWDAAVMFPLGEIPIALMGEWMASSFADIEQTFEAGVFALPYPGVNEGDDIIVPITHGSHLAIAESTAYPEEAMAVAEFMVSPAGANVIVEYMKYFVPSKGANSPEGAVSQIWEPILNRTPAEFFYGAMDNAVNVELLKGIPELYLGIVSVEEFAGNLQAAQEAGE